MLVRNGAFDNITSLKLDRNRIGNPGVASLCKVCAHGGWAKLELLDLSDNHISEDGLTALAHACAEGSFARLKTLHAGGNAVGDGGMLALSKTISLGGPSGPLMHRLLVLGLQSCKIADAGVQAFADAVRRGPHLASCEQLYMQYNAIDAAGMDAFEEAIVMGALVSCRKLALYGNPASDAKVIGAFRARAAARGSRVK